MLINKLKCDVVPQNQEQENMLKDVDFCHFLENIKKQLLNTRLDSLKTTSRKVVHKAVNFLGNIFADAVTSQTNIKLWNKNLLKKLFFHYYSTIPILNKLRQLLI